MSLNARSHIGLKENKYSWGSGLETYQLMQNHLPHIETRDVPLRHRVLVGGMSFLSVRYAVEHGTHGRSDECVIDEQLLLCLLISQPYI